MSQTVTVFHNPKCGTSRNAVELVRQAGYAVEAVEYLKAGWTEAQLTDLFARAGLTPRQAMRVKGTPAEELGLTDPSVTDAAILKAMVAHPILVERPFVAGPRGVVLARPSEKAADALDRRPASFTKEDGTVVTL